MWKTKCGSHFPIADTHNLEGDSFILVHSFNGFSPWCAGSKSEMAWWEGSSRGSCLPHGIQKAKGEGKSQGQERTFPGHNIVTCLFQPGHTSEHTRLWEDILELN